MTQYISKDALVAEINRVLNSYDTNEITSGRYALVDLRNFLDTLEVIDPYKECIQYDSIKSGIQAHAETYSFNIESKLFNQLTKEQQELWRKEIEQACISGGEVGLELAKDPRYKENVEVKEVDFDDFGFYWGEYVSNLGGDINNYEVAKYFYELGFKAQKEE